jgi:hypothetical protein
LFRFKKEKKNKNNKINKMKRKGGGNKKQNRLKKTTPRLEKNQPRKLELGPFFRGRNGTQIRKRKRKKEANQKRTPRKGAKKAGLEQNILRASWCYNSQ